MANKLNPELVQNIAELTNVKKISDLPIIDVIEHDNETENIRTSQQFNNSYLLSSTLIEDNSQVGGRYFNYRVKLNEVTDYLSTLSNANLSAFKKTFDFFVDSLKNNTKNSYVEFIPANDTIDTENTINNYSYTFKYNLSDVHDEVIGFSYSYIEGIGEQVSTYSYTNVLTNGLVTNATLEKYVRNSIATILGVPSTPAYVSEAIDSVIEFVDWFKGYVRNDTSYGSLHQLISTIESKDAKVLDNAYSYVIQNKELSYAYTETSYNKLYGTLNNALNNLNIKPIAGTNISIGEDNSINCNIGLDSTNNKSFIVGSTKYSLNFNEGKFYINELTDTYQQFVFLTKTPTNLTKEYDEDRTSDTKSITLKFSVNKDGKVLGNPTNWNLTNNTDITANTEYSYTMNCRVNVDTVFDISIIENALSPDDISFGHEQKSINYNVINTYKKFGVWIFSSASQITTDIFSLDNSLQLTANGINNVQKILWSNKTSISTSINIGENNEYVYVLIPKNWITSTYKFFWGGSTTPEDANLVCGDVKLYSNNKEYYLYRSLRIQSGDNFGVEYRKP